MTATYWQVGKRIVETEQGGADRAGYREQILVRLSADLTSRFGRGFSAENLRLMRKFYQAYQEAISQTVSGKWVEEISKTPSGKSPTDPIRQKISALFPFPWSHYVRLLPIAITRENIGRMKVRTHRLV